MLLKLLKYDLRSVFKYWWIAALSSVGISAIAGFAGSILEMGEKVPYIYQTIAYIGIILAILGISAFSILTEILIFIRYYKNFFSDEGYLTFTLPVKRTQLLTSKLITAVVASISTFIVTMIDIFIIFFISFFKDFINVENWAIFFEDIKCIIKESDGYVIVYLLEAIIGLVVLTAVGALFTFLCITIASVIAKKAKVLVAIGIYYGATSIVSFIVQLTTISTTFGLVDILEKIPENAEWKFIALVGLMLIAFATAIALLLYTIVLHLCDKKLNLN